MSYNITNWTTKQYKNFMIPLSTLYDLNSNLIDRGWKPNNPIIKDISGDSLIIEINSLGFQATGRLISRNLYISTIACNDEGSGTFYHEILLPALKQSTGELEAILVWEGGDAITHLIVKDGEVTEKDIEL
jgi:hypothetical protein